jgi:uncharacterized protein (TIGR02453 family)
LFSFNAGADQTMGKKYFTPELFLFLQQIKRNNRREWFEKNRSRHEEVVKQPCLRFILDLGLQMGKVSTWIVVSPKPNGGSLMRIYRDVRFSPNKQPYKTNVGMSFWHAGSNEDIHGPGFYLHLEPGQSFLAGGAWHPDPRSLAKIRDAIAWKAPEWKKVTRGLELGGDKLTRPPRGYQADHPMIEEIKRKDFIASITFTDKQVCSEKFLGDVAGAARKLAPMIAFLARAEGLQF